MANNVDKYTTVPEHALIDHTGLPGIGGGGGGITGEVVPAGVIIPFGGTVASIPSGYLACDGSVVAQATYPALFTAIGTTWDIGGEGGGNFRLPDLRGKSPVGLNDGTLPAGADGGFSTRNLADLGGEEAHQLTVAELASHDHNIQGSNSNQEGIDSGEFGQGTGLNRSTDTEGSDVPHNTMHPFAVVAYIIKAEEGAPTVVGIGSDTLPTGTITPYAGTVASIPVGFLPCDGSLADQTVEADLFSVIGTTWNVGGEPGGFFRLPDFRGKSIVGLNDGTLPNGVDGGFTTRTLAALGGSEADTAPLPSHNHNVEIGKVNAATPPSTGGAVQMRDNGTQTATTTSTGSGGTHNTMHPFAVCPYIIKSKQVGGGIGVTAQNNGGALEGPQPTLNFIPSGIAGVVITEDVGNSRLDITISATEVFDSAAHALVNHAGLPGVAVQSASNFTSATTTIVDVATGFTPIFAIYWWERVGVSSGVGMGTGTGAAQAFLQDGVSITTGIIGQGTSNFSITQFDATRVRATGGSTNIAAFAVAIGQ